MNEDGISIVKLISYLKEKKRLWLIIFALVLGIVLMILGGTGKTESNPQTSEASYESADALEGRVKKLCEQMSGVSDVWVMITFDTYGQRIFAKDSRENNTGNGKEVQTQYVTASGQLVPIGEMTPTLRGIAVVCRGGDNPSIRLKLTDMLCALFDISADRVSITGGG